MYITLSEIECRLNFENRPVRSTDIKGGRKQPPATNRGSQEPATNRVKGNCSPSESIYFLLVLNKILA